MSGPTAPAVGSARADAAPRRRGVDATTVALLGGLWTAALPNWPLWQALQALPEMASARGAFFGLGFGLAIAAAITLLLLLFAWRPVVKVAVVFVWVSAAIGAHYMGTYGTLLDPTMIGNVLQTDPGEVRDLLGWRLAGTVALLAVAPAVLLHWVPVRRRGPLRQFGRNLVAMLVALLAIAALVFAMFADLSATMRNHKTLRYLINPLNAYVSLGQVVRASQARPAGPPLAIGADAQVLPRAPGAKPPLLLLVVGETARADHFSLNGYPRPTNPELAAIGVVSFGQVTSCGTNTATSLPCMFSSLGKAGFESRERDHENLLDLVQRAGMAVLWVDNQSGCKGLCDRVPNAVAGIAPPSAPPLTEGLCDGEECLDGALLHGLAARLDALPAAARQRGVLIVLHQMGSHGPAYYKRSPPDRKPFGPECTTHVLQQCERASLVNAYDNSIRYTDHVLAEAIGWLREQASGYEPAMLYVSDHGESLGANNLYLHGLPYAVAPLEQKHVPMVWWAAGSAVDRGCLRQRAALPLTHDHLFHTTLGWLGVRASEYQLELDAFAACRAP